jgi:hypothetical protein
MQFTEDQGKKHDSKQSSDQGDKADVAEDQARCRHAAAMFAGLADLATGLVAKDDIGAAGFCNQRALRP